MDELVLPTLAASVFHNIDLCIDDTTKTSYLEFLTLLESDLRSAYFGLWAFIFCDESLALDGETTNLNFFFYTDSQDFFMLLLHHSPELVGALNNFLKDHHFSFSFLPEGVSFSDLFTDSLTLALTEIVEYGVLLLLFF